MACTVFDWSTLARNGLLMVWLNGLLPQTSLLSSYFTFTDLSTNIRSTACHIWNVWRIGWWIHEEFWSEPTKLTTYWWLPWRQASNWEERTLSMGNRIGKTEIVAAKVQEFASPTHFVESLHPQHILLKVYIPNTFCWYISQRCHVAECASGWHGHD